MLKQKKIMKTTLLLLSTIALSCGSCRLTEEGNVYISLINHEASEKLTLD
jgi:hypothetical protein